LAGREKGAPRGRGALFVFSEKKVFTTEGTERKTEKRKDNAETLRALTFAKKIRCGEWEHRWA
jgi:hypothetical protein